MQDNPLSSNPLSRLALAIAAAARERDLKDQKEKDEQAVRTRERDEARVIWGARKSELPDIVKAIDGMLQLHGYGGLTMGHFELKHTDIDRVVLKFEHSRFNHSNILICATLDGQFTCALGASTPGASSSDATSTIPMSDLTEVRLKEALSLAIEECLKKNAQPAGR